MYYSLAELERLDYLRTIDTSYGGIHTVHRDNIFLDVIEIYQKDKEIGKKFPLRVKYHDERAIDTGGCSKRHVMCVLGESLFENV